MIPALLTDRAALFHGRAEQARNLISRCDLICTDPPYSEHTHANLGAEKRNDGHAIRDELEFPPIGAEEIGYYASEWVKMSRGWILVFTDEYLTVEWGRAFEKAGGRFVRVGHWVKTNPMPQMTGDRPSVGTEPIVIAHSLPPGRGRMQWRGGGRAAVWRGPREPTSEVVHPTQKPRWLIQELVGLFAEPGAIVVDPFMGSGTAGVAALATERFSGSQSLLTTKRRKGEPPAVAAEVAPMPDGFSFVGVDGDPAHVATAVSRIRPLIDAELARCAAEADLGNTIASLLVG